MRGRHGVGVEQPAVIGVVGAAVAAQVGDADADDVVTVAGHAQPGFSSGQAVEAGSGADGRCAGGIECVPHADGGQGFGVRGRAGFVERLSDDGEDAIAADREGEPIGLADLAEAAAPHSAGGHGARLGYGADGVIESRRLGVGRVTVRVCVLPGGQIGECDGLQRAGRRDLALRIRAD